LGFVTSAAVAAPLRYLVDGYIAERAEGAFPWGTFVVNAGGSLLFGLITGLALYHAFPQTPKVILGTGFCGSYTTFSTFSFETVRLVEEGALGQAIRNALSTLVVCAGAAALGLALSAL
jgi:CrcB protein